MSRIQACIQMLLLLKARGFMSREDLAKELNCTKRAVIDYKVELEKAGYVIDSVTGIYGGYSLSMGTLLPMYDFHDEETRALQEARQYLRSHHDFHMLHEYDRAMDKVLYSGVTKKEANVYMDVHASLSTRILRMIQRCESAKARQQVVELRYRSLRSNSVESVKVHPYEIVNYKQAYYCLGYSLKAKDFRIYKFSEERMKDCTILETNFHRDKNFRLKDHIGKSGLVKDECIEIDVDIYHESARIVAERRIGIDDHKQWIDEHTLHLTTIIEGKLDTISFLLSLKDQCTLHAPLELKKEMRKLLEDMVGAYSH